MGKAAQITITYSQEQELRRIIFVLAQVARGFYSNKGFLLLKDYALSDLQDYRAVVLQSKVFQPLQEYVSHNGFDAAFWRENFTTADISAFSFLLPHIPNRLALKSFDIALIQKAVKLIMDFHGIQSLRVNVYVTQCGTNTSFNSQSESDITVYVRNDATERHICFGIAGEIVEMRDPRRSWEERQAIREYLMSKTSLGRLFEWETVFKDNSSSEKFQAHYEESLRNYEELGFPINSALAIDSLTNQISLQDYGEIDFLSPMENNVLALLMNRKGTIITMDDIAEIMWGVKIEKKFSLHAVSKLIERLRKKLRQNGLQKEVIFTRRGLGYTFLD